MGSGDCNIVVFLQDNSMIMDVVRVRVSSVVRPLSPVYLHLGGTVEFRILDDDDYKQNQNLQGNNVWKSSDSNIL